MNHFPRLLSLKCLLTKKRCISELPPNVIMVRVIESVWLLMKIAFQRV